MVMDHKGSISLRAAIKSIEQIQNLNGHERCKQLFLSKLKAWAIIDLQMFSENGKAIVYVDDTPVWINEAG